MKDKDLRYGINLYGKKTSFLRTSLWFQSVWNKAWVIKNQGLLWLCYRFFGFFHNFFWIESSFLSFVIKYLSISSGHKVQDNLKKQQKLTKRIKWISNNKNKISIVDPNPDIMQFRSSIIKIKTNNFEKIQRIDNTNIENPDFLWPKLWFKRSETINSSSENLFSCRTN